MIRAMCFGLAGLALLAAGPAHAVQVCAWVEETVGEDDYHELALWLEADGKADFYLGIKGGGLSSEGMRAHSPSNATFFLRAGEPERPWRFGATLSPPGDIDVIAELRALPDDIFSDEQTPLLASFAFRRHVPEGEATPPATLAAKQCATLAKPR